MIKQSIFATALLFLIASFVFAQTTGKDYTAQAYQFYQQGKFEKAIDAAEKAVKIEKLNQSKDSSSYVNTVLNLARINQGYFIELQNRNERESGSFSEKVEIYKKSVKIGADTEKLLREVIKINGKNSRDQTEQTANAKVELSSLVQKFNPEPSVQNSRARIDEAERLLTEALSTSEQIRGKDDDKTLENVLLFGDFYKKYVNFEKALPFYERYFETSERANKKYPEMENALRAYASIMSVTFQDEKVKETLKKIENITNKRAELPTEKVYLNLRSKDAINFSSDISRDRKNSGNRGVDGNIKFVRIPIKVVVDENGKIIEAVAESDDEKVRRQAENEISKWSVRPFSYQSTAHKMRGYLTYLEKK